jgi:hypothetical protein
MIFAWKFIIGRTPIPLRDGVLVNQSVAVVIAEDEASARERLREHAAREGFDSRWLDVAPVRRIEIRDGTVLAWAQGF